MPNFDALRTSTLGALSYICRPKVKPAELLLLAPLQSDALDISRYNNTILWTSPLTYDTGYMTYTMCHSTGSMTATVDADLTQPFSWECFIFDNNAKAAIFQVGNLLIRGYSSGSGPGFYVMKSGAGVQLYLTALTAAYHVAFCNTGSTIYAYVNGTKIGSTNTSGMGNATLSMQNGWFCNARFVKKALGTSTSYPVPATLYTGYEAL